MRLKDPNYKIEQSKTLLEFLNNYLNAFNPATIEIKSEKLCSDGRRRSISDLQMLCNNYLEEKVSTEDIIKCLAHIECENEGCYLAMRFCGDINKVVVKIFDHNTWNWVPLENSNIIICDLIPGENYDLNKAGVDGISIGYVINLLKEEINKINEKV